MGRGRTDSSRPEAQGLYPGFLFRRSRRRMTLLNKLQATSLSLMVPGTLEYSRRRERSREPGAETALQDPDHRRVNPPNPQIKHGALSRSGLPHHDIPGRTVKRADILLLCTAQGRRMQTSQARRHTMLALQLRLMRSTNRPCALRPGGRWSVRSRPSVPRAGEPSPLMWIRPERWFSRSSTPGSLSTCAASLLAPDKRSTQQKQTHCLSPLMFKRLQCV